MEYRGQVIQIPSRAHGLRGGGRRADSGDLLRGADFIPAFQRGRKRCAVQARKSEPGRFCRTLAGGDRPPQTGRPFPTTECIVVRFDRIINQRDYAGRMYKKSADPQWTADFGERVMGLEPTISCLGSKRSTTELHPLDGLILLYSFAQVNESRMGFLPPCYNHSYRQLILEQQR